KAAEQSLERVKQLDPYGYYGTNADNLLSEQGGDRLSAVLPADPAARVAQGAGCGREGSPGERCGLAGGGGGGRAQRPPGGGAGGPEGGRARPERRVGAGRPGDPRVQQGPADGLAPAAADARHTARRAAEPGGALPPGHPLLLAEG